MNLYRNWFQKSAFIPWRLRHALEVWLETQGWQHHPRLYRMVHFGQWADPVRQVTFGPLHHFFGYYEKSPWNTSGNLLLVHEAAFNDRPPSEDDRVTVGVVHLEEENRFIPLATTLAWNWQQGAMLQWHPVNSDHWFIHNDRRDGRFQAVVRNTQGEEIRTYRKPIYAVTPDGRFAYSLNFARLHTHRPGYGYAGGTDPWADAYHPEEDGIHRLDLSTGESKLILSLHELATTDPREEMKGVFHWINHIQTAPDGERFAFFHIWRVAEAGWRVRFYTATADGSQANCLLDTAFISHYDWLDNDHILIWARDEGTRGNFWLCDVRDRSRTVIGAGLLTEDGHCSFSPDREWVLNDTYPDSYDLRTLMLYHWEKGQRTDIARLHSPKEQWWGEIRCDLHPRWNPAGNQVCIDSVHNGERQMYLIDVSRITGRET